jgi:hypothetical protein
LHHGDDPAVVARVVVKAATSRTPKLRYPAGPLARRLALLKKYAPAGLLDNGIRKANKLTKAPKSARKQEPAESSAANLLQAAGKDGL